MHLARRLELARQNVTYLAGAEHEDAALVAAALDQIISQCEEAKASLSADIEARKAALLAGD